MKRFGPILVSALLSSTALAWGTIAMAQDESAIEQDVIEEIIVRGAYIPELKRETSEISSFLTAEDLERQGDGNAALALRRVTGLSLVGDRFIYVRGLGERYNSALLNGIPLPSPEPLRRVVPLDLFPSSILESAAAQKTYSPQYSGEFGGGLVEISTKSMPDRRTFEIGLSVGGDVETTWKDGLTYDGGSHDWLGFDSGIRDIPAPLQAAIDSGQRLNSLNFTDTELQTIGRSLVNSELWTIFEGTTPGDIAIDVTYGDRFLTGDASVGFLVSAGYDNSWTTKRGLSQTGRFGADAQGNQVLVVGDDFNFTSTQNDVQWHALLGLGADWEDTELKATSLLIHTTTKEARTVQGQAIQFDALVRQDAVEWFERQMWTNQLDGLHRFAGGDFTANWKLSYSLASRDAPYERFVQYRDFGDGQLRYDSQQGRNLTRFSYIDDKLKSGALDLVWNTMIGNREVILKSGYLYTDTDRDSEQRDYRLLPTGGPIPDELLLSRIDYIFADQNINPDRFVITEVTGSAAPPAYTGSLETHGVYVGTDAQVTDFVRAAFGVRYETGKLIVDTFDFYSPNTGIESLIDEDYWLPAGTLTWNFAENMQVRLGASQTIGRPQFRELAPAEFIDVDTDRKFVGNPNLVNSKINNFDARWEWYFADQQNLTLGGFYKNLKDPIEETINEAGDNLQTTFQNVPRATVWGVEAEFKYIIEPTSNSPWLRSKNFFFSTNYTFSESSIDIKAGDTVVRSNGTVLPAEFVIRDGRALQGHSKHLFNVQVGYEDVEADSSATLLLNYTSKRIRASSPQTLPEIVETPPITLDFNYSKDFMLWGGEYSFGLEVENILGSDYKARQEFGGNRVDVDTYKRGQAVSLSIKRSF